MHLPTWLFKHQGQDGLRRLFPQKLWIAAIVNFLYDCLPKGCVLVGIGDTIGVRLVGGEHEKLQEVFYVVLRVVRPMKI